MRKLVVVAAAIAAIISFPALATAATVPTGMTGIALDAKVELAWQPVSGATGYTVYRGASATTITTRLTSASGVTTTTFTDTTALNGTTYYYAVRSVDAGGESGNSLVVQASARARACSTGNAVVSENCFPGDGGWDVTNAANVSAGGIEGFAAAASVNKGESVALKVSSGSGGSFRIEIFRSGYYGGSGARLFSIVRTVPGVVQPSCTTDSSTGRIDCSNWSTSATLTTTSSWPSGVYLLRIVRDSNGTDNHILLTVRDDARHSDILYGVAMSDYQSYNNYGGKSLYDFNSSGAITVAGTARAVKVSFDRPFEQPRSGLRDWYTRIDYATVYWLEREGYDVAYASNTDLERNGARVLDHKAYFSPAHDEYYSAGMRGALKSARDAGVDLFFSGGNEIYWKIRFENGPGGGQDRIQVCYKSTQSGGADPSGISTGTWRDPAGANQPENGLTGIMYVGDKDFGYFPLRVSAAEGSDRVWRYTGLDVQVPGTFTNVGSELIGWEWDARVANGQEPAGVKTLASSPVTGNILQDAGRVYAPGSTTVHVVKYTASSGALVFSTGTNHWNRGLAKNVDAQGEPNVIIQQATTNVFGDMGVFPATPSSGIVVDTPGQRPPAPAGVTATALGADSVAISWSPVSGADGYNVYRSLTPRQGGLPLGQLVSGSLVTGTSFTDIGLNPTTTYYYVVTAVTGGVQSLASNEAQATTAASSGNPTRINSGGGSYTSAGGVTFQADTAFTGGSTYAVAASQTISGTTDQALYRDERWGSFSYAIPVSTGTYDVRLHFVELYYGSAVAGGAGKRVFSIDVLDTSGVDVQNLDVYAQVGANAALVRTIANVQVTDGTLNIQSIYGAADDPEIAAIEVIPQATSSPPTVTAKSPADGATGISPTASVQATFSRAMDATTINGGSLTLKRPDGSTVPASVTYDGSTKTATLTPGAPLAVSTTYTARLETTIKAADGIALAAPVSWTFTTAAAPPPPPTVTTRSPADGATGVARTTTVDATFSRDLDPTSVSTSTFSLTGPGGVVLATVTYDALSRTARLTPSASLAFSTMYTARLETGVKASDGTPLAAPVIWSFTTGASPPAPTVTATVPANAATGVARDTTVKATFSRSMDPATLTSSSFTLTPTGGAVVAATVSYDDVTKTATLTPTTQLATGTTFTARVDTSVKASDGAALASAVTWSFTTTTAVCPCSLFAPASTPALPSNPTQDGRVGSGPWSYELGVKVRLDQDADLTAVRFWKSPGETGAHKITVWSASGAKLTEVSVTGESGSGWQQQVLATPLSLQANTTYVVSVNENAFFPETAGGLATQIVSGYLRSVADGANGVYAAAAGGFPTQTWASTNYFVDVVVNAASLSAPTVTAVSPTAAATGVGVGTTVQATFSRAMDATSVTASTFTLKRPDGSLVPATIAYDSTTKTATLTPSSALANSTTYTARLETAVKAADGMPLASAVTWSFTTGAPAPAPTVTSTVPASSATGVARGTTVKATFSRSMDPATLTSSSFTLTPAGGAAVAATVSYDDGTQTVTLTPNAQLTSGTSYTARLETTVKAADGTPLAGAVSWAFTTTTAVCPCSLFAPTATPTLPSNPTKDGRTGSGPWSYELGVKVRVDQPLELTAVKFWKSPGETGAHKITVWSAAGTKLTEVTFTGESASGWQQQSLPSPLSLDAATTYVISVNENAFFPETVGGLASQIVSGYLRSVADGANGVYASAAGSFPTQTWASTNYFVDVVVNTPAQPPTVTAKSPADGASGVGPATNVQATFSRGMDATTLTASSFTLKRPDGTTVAGSVAYDAATKTATLTPSAALAYSTTYTARLDTAIKAADGIALGSAVVWTFTTAASPPAPTVAATVPASGATGVARDTTVKAMFSRSMDPSTLTSSSFTLTPSGGAAVAATVSYDDATKTATLTPSSALAVSTTYTARLETTVKATDGIALASAVAWSFTTTSSACPCQLFATSASPASSNNLTQDGRPAPGPWSYEFGVKIQVDQAVQLTAIRFWKSSLETGTHKGTVWTSGGTKLGEVTFAGESASGWQQQALGTPIALQPGTIYVISVNANAYYAVTSSGLLNAIVSGPLRSVGDGQNGVFGLAAGDFPTQSWASSNYFVDLVVG